MTKTGIEYEIYLLLIKNFCYFIKYLIYIIKQIIQLELKHKSENGSQ